MKQLKIDDIAGHCLGQRKWRKFVLLWLHEQSLSPQRPDEEAEKTRLSLLEDKLTDSLSLLLQLRNKVPKPTAADLGG